MSNRNKNRAQAQAKVITAAADIPANTAKTPDPAAALAAEVNTLLTELAMAKGNIKEGKRIRRALRARGYYGGTRTRAADIRRGKERSTFVPPQA